MGRHLFIGVVPEAGGAPQVLGTFSDIFRKTPPGEARNETSKQMVSAFSVPGTASPDRLKATAEVRRVLELAIKGCPLRAKICHIMFLILATASGLEGSLASTEKCVDE